MNKRNIISILLISLVLNNISSYTTVLATENKANHLNSVAEENENSSPDKSSVEPYGFMAYIYSDSTFTNLESIKFNIDSNKLIDDKDVNSARFIGYLKPSESKSYKFSTSNNENCVLKINNEILINKDKSNSIELEKDKLYPIELEASGISGDFELFLVDSNSDKESIKKENILLPNPSYEFTPILTGSPSLYDSPPVESGPSDESDNNIIKDSDKDGIPDEWEVNGYTLKNNEILKWSNDLESEGYTKYVSNPYKSKTSNDPYTDMQKVIGQIPSATKLEARDPMIPAVPKISVGMENLIMSKNQNITEGTSGSKTVSTTKTDTITHGVNCWCRSRICQ